MPGPVEPCSAPDRPAAWLGGSHRPLIAHGPLYAWRALGPWRGPPWAATEAAGGEGTPGLLPQAGVYPQAFTPTLALHTR
jgi:hypothetical protein